MYYLCVCVLSLIILHIIDLMLIVGMFGFAGGVKKATKKGAKKGAKKAAAKKKWGQVTDSRFFNVIIKFFFVFFFSITWTNLDPGK